MRRISLIGVIIAFIVTGVIFSFSGASFALNDKIASGVYVGNISVGGLTRQQAREQLAPLAEKLADTMVTIRHGDKNWTFKAGSLGVTLDFEKTLQEAAAIGHTGSLLNQWREQHRVKRDGAYIAPQVSTDRAMLEKNILAEAGEIITEPVNAGFRITPDDRVEIAPAQTGTSIDFDMLEREISSLVIAAVQKEGESSGAEPDTLQLPLLAIEPQRTTEDIEAMQINGRVAKYTTSFDAGQAGRTYNIKVAAAALDGLLMAPGDTFSFNQVVGPRSSEAGYKNANVIVNNEFVQGLGGGVCQVSSTLYNAVLLADLKITDRSNHTLPVGYVPIGRDATVVYGAIDFKFINNKKNYIYISSLVEGNTLTIKIYGNKETSPQVEVASWITETIEQKVVYEEDPNLAAGEQVVKQKGNNGYKVTTVRYRWENGERKTEYLPESYYHPVNRVVAVGTGQVKPSVVIPPDNIVEPVSAGENPDPEPGESGETGTADPGTTDPEVPPVNGDNRDDNHDAAAGPPVTGCEAPSDPALCETPDQTTGPVPGPVVKIEILEDIEERL